MAPRGSSPHTRGLLVTTGFRGLSPGIIPAHAGFTCRPTSRPLTPRDHPRTRGVYRLVVEGGVAPRGSSPHTRGLRSRAQPQSSAERIIPAHAGFTTACPWPVPAGSDHPRTRGVYNFNVLWSGWRDGSSPHTRGLLCGGVLVAGSPRIIPAHAGFTAMRPPMRRHGGDHPRTRGVYFEGVVEHGGSGGSSPHTRGLPILTRVCIVMGGIIPAHAGFTPSVAFPTALGWDHPRTRGVYAARATPTRRSPGSSPHTRGLPVGGLVHVGDPGIIPAHAGMIRPGRRSPRGRPRKPRTRGDDPHSWAGSRGLAV